MANNCLKDESFVFKSVSRTNDMISIAKLDIRIVREMRVVADYFIEQINFAKECYIDYFIVDYDDNHIFERLIQLVLDKSESDFSDIFRWERNIPFAAAYIVKWLLPQNIILDSAGFTRNGMTSYGVGIRLV